LHRIYIKLSLYCILALSPVFSRVFETVYYNRLTVWFSAYDLTGVQLWMHIVIYNTSMLKLLTKMYFTYCFCNIVVVDDYYIFCYYYFTAVLETCISVPSPRVQLVTTIFCTLYIVSLPNQIDLLYQNFNFV